MRFGLIGRRENAPRGNGAVVGGLFFAVRGVVALNDVNQVGNRVLFPFLPPFPFNDGAFLTRWILLPLGLPFLLGERRLGGAQCIDVPVLRPHGLARWQDGRELNQLLLVRLGLLRLRVDQFSRQVLHGPPCHDDDDGTARL